MSLPLSYLELGSTGEDSDSQVQAVRIACDGEVQELDVPKLQATSISASDRAFRDDSCISEITRFLGITITARKIALNNQFEVDLTNDEAASLFINCDIGSLDPDRPTFGVIHEAWEEDTGPLVVARLDEKPLHSLHVAAIIAFVKTKMQPLFEDCVFAEKAWRHQYGAKEMIFQRRREVLAEATPSKFLEFFDKYKNERVIGRPHLMKPFKQLSYSERTEVKSLPPDELEPRPEWEEIPSPYDI